MTKKQEGVSMIEFAVIAPVVLLVGLGMLQIGFLMHAKSALNFALLEGARLGAVSNGNVGEIDRGIISGLVPYRGGGTSASDLAATYVSVSAEFQQGKLEQWIKLRQLSPVTQSFTDWAEPAVDETGASVQEIPNANLAFLRCTKVPTGGTSGTKSSSACGARGEAIGVNSQQTLADANLLKLELKYGVKVAVPFVGRIVTLGMSMMAGCPSTLPKAIKVGTTDFGTPVLDATARLDDCFFYAKDRLPVTVTTTVRMQSPLRVAGNGSSSIITARVNNANTAGVQLGNGTVDAASNFAPIAVATLNPTGVKLADDTAYAKYIASKAQKGDGSLDFGSNTDWTRDPSGPGGGSACLPANPPGGASGPGPTPAPVPPGPSN
jgi:Flp pilus assembly protein TadG